MNLQDAIKSLQSLPPIITVTKRNLGPRYAVTVKSQDGAAAELSVKLNPKLGAQKALAMRLELTGGKFSLSVKRATETVPVLDEDGNDLGYTREKALIEGLPAAMVLTEHARGSVQNAGPVVVDKADDFTAVTFCLAAAQHESERKQRREARQRVMAVQRGEKPAHVAAPAPAPAPVAVPELERPNQSDKPKRS